MPELTFSEWDDFLTQYPQAHVLQTSAWGILKSKFSWQAVPVVNGSAGALVLFRRLPLGFSIAYIPKGPLGENWNDLWPEIDRACRRRKAIFLQVEPDAFEPASASLLDGLGGFQQVEKTIQPRQTIVVSLEGSEDDWLQRMKQKTRYNVRLAMKKEVIVRETNDVAQFHALMSTTGERDQFGVHSLTYYQAAYDLFSERGECALLQAEYAGKPLAAVMVFARGKRSWYFYGASSNEERNRMPAYLVQWEAMRWARARGCSEYDLWGIPDLPEETLEADFTQREDGLWSVYRFKRGFGGQIQRSTGAYDHVYMPLLYRAYQIAARARSGGENQ